MTAHRPQGVRRQARGRKRGAVRLLAHLRETMDRMLERSSRRADRRRPAVTLIGLDVSRPPLRLQSRSWIPAAAAVLVGALFLASLRMDVTRMRLMLGEAFKEELRLEEVERELTVDMRRLRDPALLARIAAERGFRRAEKLIDLPSSSDHAGGARRASFETTRRLAVAAGPGNRP